MPCYIKSHSMGEFVFDHSWAEAYERAGQDYYPKVLSAVPVSPVPGRRFLVGVDQRVDLCLTERTADQRPRRKTIGKQRVRKIRNGPDGTKTVTAQSRQM